MTAIEFWDEPPDPKILKAKDPLDEAQIATLWSLFKAISVHWDLESDPTNDFRVELLRSRWLDMLEARGTGEPDYRGEYANAAQVYDALVTELGEPAAIRKIYQDTLVKDEKEATTRLKHAKFYVVHDFIRCFIANGGFRGFVKEARNSTGFMGGSRFREWDPVRTGDKK